MSIESLRGALVAEHAAIYGYGIVGAHLTGDAQGVARDADARHRNRRDELVASIQAAGGDFVPAEPAYALPFPVTDAGSAMRLAVTLEEGAAGAWREALGTTAGDERRFALDALIDCAVTATRWRRMAQIEPMTVPFPGGV